jgi:hypothetical protein
MKSKKTCCFLFLMCAMICCAGCSAWNPSTLFMSRDERDAYFHSVPAFQDQATAADASGTLWKVQNDSFLGKPYNNILTFGDNILLVGEASYRSLLDGSLFGPADDASYEFSFDVYSPWYNRITASLSHTEIACSSYQVCGDFLFLLDENAMTLARYDTTLTEIGRYDLSSFEDADTLTFYPSADPDICFAAAEDTDQIVQIRFSEESIICTPVELPYYDIRVLYASPDEGTLCILGVSETSLRETIAQIDTGSLSVTEEYAAADASEILLDSGLTFFPSGNLLLRRMTQDEDTQDYISTSTCYDASGNGIASFSYDCGDYSSTDDFEYLSKDSAFFEEESLGFFLVYNSDCQPYLLVWDYSTPSTGIEPLDLPALEQVTEDTENSDSGWGELSSLRSQADALGQQYDIEIKFGSDVPEEIGIYQLNGCSDKRQISEALDILSRTLSCYPDQFFPQLCLGDNTGIILYLSETISGDTANMLDAPTGFIDSVDHHLVMVLSTEYLWDWEYTISHEISHMIDQRLEYRAVYVDDSLFSENTWSSFNPDGCEYLNTYENYEENGQYELYADYFADAYGMTFPTEDRAELFGLAMSDYLGNFDEDVFFKADAPTTEKYRYYCACIRDGFDTTGWADVMPWEEIIPD